MAPRPSHATTLLALFEPDAPLAPALERCRALGVPDRFLDVLSTLPLSEPHGHAPSRAPLHRWALAGGALGLLVGVALAAGTALLYPLNTGGFPIVAPPVVGLIAFEGMMLFAIGLTCLAMARRIRAARGSVPDRRIDDGMIGLTVVLGDDLPPADALRRALLEAGARAVVRR